MQACCWLAQGPKPNMHACCRLAQGPKPNVRTCPQVIRCGYMCKWSPAAVPCASFEAWAQLMDNVAATSPDKLHKWVG